MEFSKVASRNTPTSILESKIFTLNGSNAKFFLSFEPTNKTKNGSKEYSSLYLVSKDSNEAVSIELKYRFWIENRYGKKIKPGNSNIYFYSNNLFLGLNFKFESIRDLFGYTEFVHHDRLYSPQNDFVKDDFICCEISSVVSFLNEIDEQLRSIEIGKK
jgi:hypothetical protein